jgi:hypothetical protein
MKGYPPAILVDTWLYLATNQKPELEHVKLPISRAIKELFGSMEIAQFYVEHAKKDEVEIYFV